MKQYFKNIINYIKLIFGKEIKDEKQSISKLISNYSEEIDWEDIPNINENTGEINLNGIKHLPYNKEIWFPNINNENDTNR